MIIPYNNKRKGIFKIDLRWIKENNTLLSRIFSKCVILRAEAMLIDNTIEYHALSDLFDEVHLGEKIPTYIVLYNMVDDSWRFKREANR